MKITVFVKTKRIVNQYPNNIQVHNNHVDDTDKYRVVKNNFFCSNVSNICTVLYTIFVQSTRNYYHGLFSTIIYIFSNLHPIPIKEVNISVF